jgi:cytochrome c-type biogenesis protein CcmF
MSLVPWLLLIAGIHTNLIAKATGYSIKTTIIFYLLSFIMIVYASFLTRSGILGDSSAHAFTQMGLEWQLVLFCLLVTIVSFYLFFKRHREIPSKEQEEQVTSREFWMLIGSLVLLFSALLISFTTSIPVYNKVLDLIGSIFNTSLESWHRSTPLDPVKHHNQFQLWIAVFVCLLSASSLFLKYLGDRRVKLSRTFYINTSVSFMISMILFLISYQSFEKLHWSHSLLLFTTWYAIVSSVIYLIRMIPTHPKVLSPVLSHGGFGIFLLGVIFTGINKNIISHNRFAQESLLNEQSDDELAKHLSLIKGQKMFMNGYWVLYEKDTFVLKSRIYTLNFWKEDSLGNITESFDLYPEVQYDNKLSKVAAANPSTRHYLNKDIFSLIAQIPQAQTDAELAQKAEDNMEYELYHCVLNDTFYTKKHYLILKNITTQLEPKDFELKPGDQKLQLTLQVKRLEDDTTMVAKPGILFRNQLMYKFPFQIDPYEMRIQVSDSVYEALVPDLSTIDYTSINLKLGEEVEIGDNKFLKLKGFTKNVESDQLQITDTDIALAAQLEYKNGNDTCELNPIYLIRGNQVISLPVQSILPGITIRFDRIDPEKEIMYFDYHIHKDISTVQIPIMVAENAPRNDFIVIQVIEFPWINLVWLGSILMLGGLLLSSYHKRNSKNHAT